MTDNSKAIEKRDETSIEAHRETIVKAIASVCTEEHLTSCPCQIDKIKQRWLELWTQTQEDLKAEGHEGKVELYERRKFFDKQRAIQQIGEELSKAGTICEREAHSIRGELKLFDKQVGGKYDLSDPRVNVIVKELMYCHMSVFRMQRESNIRGVIYETDDQHGNTHWNINPVEVEKRRYSESRVKAIEALDRMMEGSKHKMLGKFEIITPEEMFGDPENQGEPEEVEEIE